MRLLFIIDNLSTGGAQRQMVNLAVGLSRRHHEIEVFCYYPQDLLADPVRQAGIPIRLCEKKHKYSVSPVAGLRRLLRADSYDAILSYLTTPNIYAILAARSLSKRPRIVVSERWCDPQGGPAREVRLVRQFYRFADHVVTNSCHQKNSLLRAHPWMQGRVSTIYNGYDLSIFRQQESRLPSGNLRILVISSVSPWKNGLCLIRALRILRSQYGIAPTVSWVGERFSTGSHQAYLQSMEHEIDSLGLRQQWNWLGQRKDTVHLMNSHDVLVHPSYAEGLPNAVCESMACGLPAIVSDCLDHPKLIETGKTGFLFDWKEPAALADAIRKFHDMDSESRRRMSEQARGFAEAHLSDELFAGRYESLFESLSRIRRDIGEVA